MRAAAPPGIACLLMMVRCRVTTFDADVVYVVAVGRHDDARFYNDLSEALGTRAVGVRREQKPGCCGTEGWPSLGPFPKGK